MLAYAITDPSTLHFDSLEADLSHIRSLASMVVYRDKFNPDYASCARRFVECSRMLGFETIVLHQQIGLAKTLRADGVHLASSQIEQVPEAKLRGLRVVVSTHTPKEALRAEKLGADWITYSPIFCSPGKGVPLGLGALNELKAIINLPIIALGGVLTSEQIEACAAHGAAGFASIRYRTGQIDIGKNHKDKTLKQCRKSQ
jgi:thiamine-phosphate pyrophosphorylase